MSLRTIYVESEIAEVKRKNSQIVVSSPSGEGIFDPEEVGSVILGGQNVVISKRALDLLAYHGAIVIVLGERYLPSGYFAPYQKNCLLSQRLQYQVSCSLPLKKQMWKQIICSKIRMQSSVLQKVHRDDNGIGNLIDTVRSGDSTNVEAKAARRYWSYLFRSGKFKRAPANPDQNAWLNFGYAVVRSAILRSVAGAGLNHSLGIHHKSKYNPFCLADDLIEPFRPVVDLKVWELWQEADSKELNRSIKRALVDVLEEKIQSGRVDSKVCTAIGELVDSIVSSFKAKKVALRLPTSVK